MNISVSEINSYLSCQKKHELAWRRRLQRRREGPDAPSLGSLVHAGLAAAMRNWAGPDPYSSTYPAEGRSPKSDADTAIDAWMQEQRVSLDPITGMQIVVPDEWQETVELAKGLVGRVLGQLAGRFSPVWWNDEPLIEWRFEVPVTGDIVFVGQIDAVMRDERTGSIHIWDWKTARSFTDPELITLSMQLGLYQEALQRVTGIEAQYGTIYQILSRLPDQPALLKSGKALSRANITTDWATYKGAVLRHGFDPKDYEDMHEKLADKEFFRQTSTVRGARWRAYLWDQMELVANQLWNTNRDYEAPGIYSPYACRGCQFVPLCQADLEGIPRQEVIETMYEYRVE